MKQQIDLSYETVFHDRKSTKVIIEALTPSVAKTLEKVIEEDDGLLKELPECFFSYTDTHGTRVKESITGGLIKYEGNASQYVDSMPEGCRKAYIEVSQDKYGKLVDLMKDYLEEKGFQVNDFRKMDYHDQEILD